VKSSQELAYMRTAARIVEAMHARIAEKVEPGMRKCDLVAEIYDAGTRGLPDAGGDYPALVPLVASGADAAAPHLTWNDRPMQSGEGTFFEIAGCYKRYHCPISRTVFLGKPPQKFLEAEQAVLEGMEAGLGQAKPGNTCEDIAKAFFAVLARHGIVKENRTGYPIGLSYPPDWGERTMSLRPGDRSVLEPGMTFHFMTGLWLEDWGLEITESIAITDSGVECLAAVPRKLLVKAEGSSPSARSNRTDRTPERPMVESIRNDLGIAGLLHHPVGRARQACGLSQPALVAQRQCLGCDPHPDPRDPRWRGTDRAVHRGQPW
jgi:ectoine hydrolase